MKITWKKNVNDSKNKTRKRPISLNPYLPFEDLESISDADSAAEPLNDGNLVGTRGLFHKGPKNDEESEQRRNLAGEFEAQ